MTRETNTPAPMSQSLQVAQSLGFEQLDLIFNGIVTRPGTFRVTVLGLQRVPLYSTWRGTFLGRLT